MPYSSPDDLPSLEAIAAAVTARRAGSFSAAAAQLGTTHAAISRRVAAAEAWCGHPLFERVARGIRVTAAGERTLGRLEAVLEQLQQVGSRRLPKSTLPVVRLGTTPSFTRFWLLPRMRQLQGEPADLQVAINADLRLADLQGGEIDVAVRYGRGGWGVGTEYPLWEEQLVPVVAAEDGRTMATQRALLAAPLLHAGDTQNWRAWCQAHGIGYRTKASDRQLTDYAMTLDAAAAGLGAALWNPALHALPAGLRAQPEWAVPAELSYHLLVRHGDAGSPAATLARRLRAVR